MRKAGVLLHISSLHGDFGCGCFGKEAYEFADFLYHSGFRIWQVLPFNVPHKDASPYSSVSTFLQNPLFIDPRALMERGLLTQEEIDQLICESSTLSDSFYDLAIVREKYLRLASDRAFKTDIYNKVIHFVNSSKNIVDACNYISRDNPTEKNFFYYAFIQYEFNRQWSEFHCYLKQKGIEVIGDIPIYADLNSSEVFYNKDCFVLDESGEPIFVSGVPGDSFNAYGQKWGHPVYSTEALEKNNYSLLFDRMKFASELYDVTRIDHFQAIGAYFAIPKDSDPCEGTWKKGVGEPFVKMLCEKIGKECFIVEDFNCFPGGSHDLAVKYGLPDMNTLQFTLGAEKSADSYPISTVAYTGTHDNDTFVGFLSSLSREKRKAIASLLGLSPLARIKTIAKAAIESLLLSPAERTVIQAQDLLLQGSESRMNVPGISGNGNWTYRITKNDMISLIKSQNKFKKLIIKSNRMEN